MCLTEERPGPVLLWAFPARVRSAVAPAVRLPLWRGYRRFFSFSRADFLAFGPGSVTHWLGSPVALYLGSAGVGRITIVDGDRSAPAPQNATNADGAWT